MRSSWAGVLALCILGGLFFGGVGCRDLTLPQEADPVDLPESFVHVFVDGLGSSMDRTVVTIDNTPYVGPTEARTWEAQTNLRVARFDGAPPGRYDVHIDPPDFNNTPQWTEYGIDLDEDATVLKYQGITVNFTLDWPELASIEHAPDQVGVRLEGTDSDGPLNDDWTPGRYEGVPNGSGGLSVEVPWAAQYVVQAIHSSTEFRINYQYPDTLEAVDGAHVDLPSPLITRTISLSAVGGPIPGNYVRITQSALGTLSYNLEYYLSYWLQSTDAADSLILLEPRDSTFAVSWASGPAFPHRIQLLHPPAMDPGAVNLGDYAWTLHVQDEDGNELPQGRFYYVSPYSDYLWYTDANGTLVAWLDQGYHVITAEAAGFRNRSVAIDLDGDQETIVILERE